MIHLKKTHLSMTSSQLARFSACIAAAGTLATGCAGTDENGRQDPATLRQGPVPSAVPESFDEEERVAALSPEMFHALERDLGLSRSQVLERDARLRSGTPIAERLREELGDAFGGAWMPENGEGLVIGVTDAALQARVQAEGLEPRLVKYGEAKLRGFVERMKGAPDGFDLAYPDVENGQVVIEAQPGSEAEVAAFVAARGLDPATVRIVPSRGRVTVTSDVRAGDYYRTRLSNGAIDECSAGFGVEDVLLGLRGFVTAGHCGTFANGVTINGENGIVAGSTFPVVDHAWVRIQNIQAPTPFVNDYGLGLRTITGSQSTAPIGAMACRSGTKTQWRCGTVLREGVFARAFDTSGNALGDVGGLVETAACAEPGDSGGPVVTGTLALGVVSSSRGTCASRGTSFYQPVQAALTAYGLRLLTIDDPGPGPVKPFVITTFTCLPGIQPHCGVRWVNDVQPSTVQWTTDGTSVTVATDPVGQLSTARLNCQVRPYGIPVTVTATITDSIQQVRTATGSIYCPGRHDND